VSHAFDDGYSTAATKTLDELEITSFHIALHPVATLLYAGSAIINDYLDRDTVSMMSNFPERLVASVSDRMRADWNARAREDAYYYVAFGGRGQGEEQFDATVADVLPCLEVELKRFPKSANRRALRALEIGCGPGRLMKPLSCHFGEIHGVDVSEEMVRLGRARLRNIRHAHIHSTDGASLTQFADESFDFVYSYAVFQHIPSREVVFEYMRETCRVLKPGGVFRGQFNGLPLQGEPNTWSGVVFTAEDIRAFTRANSLLLLDLVGECTQYMWTTWRRRAFPQYHRDKASTSIRAISNACTGETVVPNAGRYAALAIWVENLPDDGDLNTIDILIDHLSSCPFHIAPPSADQCQQINFWLPTGVRTGLLPVELRFGGHRLGEPSTLRVVPAGPLVPRIFSVTDGVNLAQKNRSSSGFLKVNIEEVGADASFAVSVDNEPIPRIQFACADPRPPRFELDIELPKGLTSGPHVLQVRVGARRLLSADILVG
jgi:SAM-dependent methyltransferase